MSAKLCPIDKETHITDFPFIFDLRFLNLKLICDTKPWLSCQRKTDFNLIDRIILIPKVKNTFAVLHKIFIVPYQIFLFAFQIIFGRIFQLWITHGFDIVSMWNKFEKFTNAKNIENIRQRTNKYHIEPKMIKRHRKKLFTTLLCHLVKKYYPCSVKGGYWIPRCDFVLFSVIFMQIYFSAFNNRSNSMHIAHNIVWFIVRRNLPKIYYKQRHSIRSNSNGFW